MELVRLEEHLPPGAIQLHDFNGAQPDIAPVQLLGATIDIQAAGPFHGHRTGALGQQLLVSAIHPGAVDAGLAGLRLPLRPVEQPGRWVQFQ